MSINIAILLVAIVFIYMIATGHYITTTLFAAGIVGIYLIAGPAKVAGFLSSLPYSSAASYTLTTIPMYILMANFIMKAGIINSLYGAVHKLSKGRASVLGVMTIILGGVLGAVSGSGTASAAGLSQCAYPELRQKGYSEDLASSIVAISGSLSAIIPPTSVLIVFGVAAELSVSKLFMAAFIPGIITVVVFCFVTVYFYHRDQKLGRVQPLSEEEQKMAAEQEKVKQRGTLFVVICGILIIVCIFGGIYSGFFTPTEAGAVGALIGLVAAIASGNFSFKFFIESIRATANSTAMIMGMCIAAAVFARFISLSLIPKKITELLQPLIAHPAILLVVILIFYFIMFMLLDSTSPILMTTAIIMPLVTAAGYDPIWFGIFVCLDATLGLVTPPVGVVAYVVAGQLKLESSRIFKICVPYAVVGAVVVGGLMIAFPQLATWLPSILN